MSYQWDFDNDTTIDSTLQNAAYTYTHSGLYAVRLTVTNAENTSQKVKTAFYPCESGR